MWRFNIDPNDGNRLTPLPDDDVSDLTQNLSLMTMQYDAKHGLVLAAMHEDLDHSINALYECENKNELIKYYHVSLCSHPKSTLIAAAKAGYLRGFPELTAEAIGKFIKTEEATEAGHMRATPKGVRSTTTQTRRGRPPKNVQDRTEERIAAMEDSMLIP